MEREDAAPVGGVCLEDLPRHALVRQRPFSGLEPNPPDGVAAAAPGRAQPETPGFARTSASAGAARGSRSASSASDSARTCTTGVPAFTFASSPRSGSSASGLRVRPSATMKLSRSGIRRPNAASPCALIVICGSRPLTCPASVSAPVASPRMPSTCAYTRRALGTVAFA